MQQGIPWWGHLLSSSLNLSHALYKLSSSSWWKDVISFLNFALLVGGKYFIKNLSAKSFHVVIESGGKEFNHVRAQSLKEYEKSLSLNAYSDAPAILKASLISKNSLGWRWGSSDGNPLNCPTICNIWNITSFSSKLASCTSGLTIAGCITWGVNTA